jgi:hypothetical protein
MTTLGIELCDADLQTVALDQSGLRLLPVAEGAAPLGWPGFVYHDGEKFHFGRAGEDAWFVQPRRVCLTFWQKLSHESSPLTVGGKTQSYSEIAFYFFRDYLQRLAKAQGAAEKVVLAVPGAFLKDAGTEEERVGLLLGMAGELKLPVAGIVDMACAALCDPRSGGFNPALPVVVVDVHLQGADVSLVAAEQQLERKAFRHLPQSGFAQLFRHLNGTMGNRFLRHTAFDILEDGQIEQSFYRQLKDFTLGGAAEYRFQINTGNRGYEMLAKREQLEADAQPLMGALVQAVLAFVQDAGQSPALCTVALPDRTARLPGLEGRLRATGFTRLLRLPEGAAAAGAATTGQTRWPVVDLADVPVASALPLADARRAVGAPWEARLKKPPSAGPRPAPTHAIFEGIGFALAGDGRFTIGAKSAGCDVVLPETFNDAGNCVVQFVREGARLWLLEPAAAARTEVGAGDRIVVRCGTLTAEVLFARCPGGAGA